MWKTYKSSDKEQLNEETRQLSLNAARYEIHAIANGIQVETRCRKESSVYNLCKSLGFDFY